MNRRIVWLNLALVALAASLVWVLRASWLEAQARERAVLQRRATPKAVLAPPSPPAVKAVMPAEYLEVADKMLFSKDRNSTVVVEPPKPPPEPVMPALPTYHGQIAIGEPVILLSASPNLQRSYHAGDQVGEFTLVSFDRDTAAFEWKGKSVERKLEELRPKQIVAQAGPGGVLSPIGGAPAATPTPNLPAPKSVSSLDRPKAAAPVAAASPVATTSSGKAVTSLSGPPGANAGSADSADASEDGILGAVLPGGVRACVSSDNSPAGTIHSGYRKVEAMSILGPSCDWEVVK